MRPEDVEGLTVGGLLDLVAERRPEDDALIYVNRGLRARCPAHDHRRGHERDTAPRHRPGLRHPRKHGRGRMSRRYAPRPHPPGRKSRRRRGDGGEE